MLLQRNESCEINLKSDHWTWIGKIRVFSDNGKKKFQNVARDWYLKKNTHKFLVTGG